MSLINIMTHEYILFLATVVFAILCIINSAYKGKTFKSLIYVVFGAEALILLAFFLISGIPDGFSALWICLIPSFTLLIFGIKIGSLYSAVALFKVIFLFWFPLGREILLYEYSNAFMMRFPCLYFTIYILALFIEYIRQITYRSLVQIQEQYRYLYCHDSLTGLYNRYGFNERLTERFEKSSNKRFSVIMIDIDFFKKINDCFGHDSGDEVLRQTARIIDEFTCCDCLCCHWGGEEFNIFTVCAHSPYDIAENIRCAVERNKILFHGEIINVTISAGVCTAEEAFASDMEAIIKCADECLYRAKNLGRNRVEYMLMDFSKKRSEP